MIIQYNDEIPKPVAKRMGVNWDWFFFKTLEEAQLAYEWVAGGSNMIHGQSRVSSPEMSDNGLWFVHVHFFNTNKLVVPDQTIGFSQ